LAFNSTESHIFGARRQQMLIPAFRIIKTTVTEKQAGRETESFRRNKNLKKD